MDFLSALDGASPLQLLGVLIAGVVAGFINTLAGGGSLLTLPALIMLGLPPDVANGTNRIGVVVQAVVSTLAFRRAGKLDADAMRDVMPPALVGAAVGALVAAFGVPRDMIGPVLLGFLVLMALLLTFRPNLLMNDPTGTPLRIVDNRQAYLWLFLAGLYGGFIQAGVGFLLLATLGASLKYDFVRANALKIVTVLAHNVISLGIFVSAGQVHWVFGIILSIGTAVGGLLGARFALKVPQKVLRAILLATVLVAAGAALRKLLLAE